MWKKYLLNVVMVCSEENGRKTATVLQFSLCICHQEAEMLVDREV